MRAEIAKVRYLPMPRVVAAVAFVVALLPGTLLLIFQPAHQGIYVSSAGISFSLVMEVLAISLGTWMATLEFGSGTLQRTLTAESDRNRVLVAKFVTVLGFTLLLAVAAGAVSGGITDLAMDSAGVTNREGLLRTLLSSLPEIFVGVSIGFGFGLMTKSMGGGITLAVVFAFVADGFVNFIPHVGDWYFTAFSNGIDYRIVGASTGNVIEPQYGLAVSIIGMLAWLAVVVVPGWLMFTKGDLK